MSAWGSSSPFRSCDSLIQRIERNDPTLTDLVILPTKTFGADEVNRLCAVLENNTNTYWKSLSASGHVISLESLCKLGRAIAANTSTPLSSLALGDRSMGDEGVSALCSALGRKHKLQTIDLSYKNMNSAGFHSVLETLAVSPTLSSLNLSRNPSIGQAAVDANTAPLFENVIELDVSDCGITGLFASQFFSKLVPGKANRAFVLSNNPLGPEGLRSLEPLLGDIVTLNVSNGSLGNDGMQVLASFGPTAIVSLDLSRNNVTLKGIPSFISCLHRESGEFSTTTGSLNHLEKLDLSSNPISEEGVCILVNEGLAKSNIEPLRFLDLSETDAGVKGACTALTHSKAVSLRLFNNKLGSDGFRALSELIQDIHVAPGLESLDLAGNNADIDSVVSLLTGVHKRESEAGPSRLRSLVIGGNASGTEVEEMVAKIQQVRPDLDIARDKSNKKA